MDEGQGLTIPKAVYEATEARLRSAYASEFGAEQAGGGDGTAIRGFTREETIVRYSSALRFWKRHLPDLQPGMGLDVVAAHAICSNAVRMLTAKCTDYGILNEVERAVDAGADSGRRP